MCVLCGAVFGEQNVFFAVMLNAPRLAGASSKFGYLMRCSFRGSRSVIQGEVIAMRASTKPSLRCVRAVHLSPHSWDEKHKKQWSVVMSDETKRKKKEHIKNQQEEQVPTSLVGKLKYYIKRYWYIAVPTHAVCCTLYFGVFFAVVYSGVDVIGLLETLQMPAFVLEKLKSTPPGAGVAVVAFILYKLATPLRYLTTIGLIQVAFRVLKRWGLLKTAREVEYSSRLEYEKVVRIYGRRLYRNRHKGVREISKENVVSQTKSLNDMSKVREKNN